MKWSGKCHLLQNKCHHGTNRTFTTTTSNSCYYSKGWPILVLNLKNCFCTFVHLHSKDCKRFAFTLPSLNLSEPMKRYHWKLLSQEMAESTLYQKLVAAALKRARELFHLDFIIHYMDDILITAKNNKILGDLFA